MRDLVIFATIFFALPFCFARPYVGILVFAWISYMNPHRLTWSAAYNFEFAFIVAVVTLLGFTYQGIINGKLLNLPRTRETYLLLALWFMFFFTTFWAIYPDDAWYVFKKISKILIMTFLTISLIDDLRKLRYLLLVISLSIGFYGIKGGIFSIITGGENMLWGPPQSAIADNTGLGLGLNMTIPFLYFLARNEENIWLKRFLYLTCIFSGIAVIFTYSRGAFIGLAVVCFFLYLSMDIRKKLMFIAAGMICLPVIIASLPDRLFDRVDTLVGYKEDGSANARFNAWIAAWNLALDKPLTGGGFSAISYVDTVTQYNSRATIADVGVHNLYLEVLSENGFITFFIYMFLMFSSLASAMKIRRWAIRTRNDTYHAYANIVIVSIFAFMSNGTFIEVATFDLYLHVVAILVILKVLYTGELLADTGKEFSSGNLAAAHPAGASGTAGTAATALRENRRLRIPPE